MNFKIVTHSVRRAINGYQKKTQFQTTLPEFCNQSLLKVVDGQIGVKLDDNHKAYFPRC